MNTITIKESSDFIHDEKSQKFIHEMNPVNAFVSYKWLGDIPEQGGMLLTHIEVPQSARGTGLGARFAIQVLKHLESCEHEINISCSFMRKVARTKKHWRNKYNVND